MTPNEEDKAESKSRGWVEMPCGCGIWMDIGETSSRKVGPGCDVLGHLSPMWTEQARWSTASSSDLPGLHGRRGADPPQSRAAWLRARPAGPPRPMVQRGKRQLHFSSLCRVDCFGCVVHTTQHTSILATKTTPSATRPDRDLPGHHRRHPHRPPSLSLSAIAVMTTTFVAEQRSLDSGKLNASNRSAPRPPCLGRKTLNCRC